ncbi:hypothetical protein PWT90_09239 [Aphanocladium album]|nr:hypothetical protein PWT90_09239 [Aphanocladium album]
MPLAASFTRLLVTARENGEHCDYELRCNGVAVKVHKIIVGMQSPVLNSAFTGPFKENYDGFYNIKDFSVDIVEGAVEYFYTGDYTTRVAEQGGDSSTLGKTDSLLFHARMVCFADKYLVDGLRASSKTKFEQFANSTADIFCVLDAVPPLYALPGESIEELGKLLGADVRNRMAVVAHSPEIQTSIQEIACCCPQFLANMLEKVWKEDFSSRRRYR